MRSARLAFASCRSNSLNLGALFVLLLVGCSGSTGPGGPAGTAGAVGPPGTPGGTATAVSLTKAGAMTATITGVTIPASPPAQPVVKFQLVNESGQPLSGLTAAQISFAVAKLVAAGTQLAAVPPQTAPPASLVSSQWQSYIYTTATPAPTTAGRLTEPVVGTIPRPQATTEPGNAGKLVDNGDGTYQYTFAKDISADAAVPYTATLTHRVGFEIRGVTNLAGTAIAANSPVYTFQPSTGATAGIAQYDIVEDQTCKNCHQVLAWHGGARTEIKYCVMCHNPSSIDPSSGNTLDFKVMFHKIHMGQDLPTVTGKSLGNGASVGINMSNYYIFGYRNSINDYSTVAYPQADASNNSLTVSGTGQRFCVTCHNVADPLTPQAGNFSTAVSAAACGSCHDDINFATGQNHGSSIVATDSQCSTCHGATSNLDGGALTVVAAHQNAVDTAIAKFQYNIVSIINTAPGQFPTATIKVTDPTNGGAPYDITSATSPFNIAGSALNLDVAWDTIDVNNLGSGSAASPITGTPNQPITISFTGGAGATPNPDGSFTKTATIPIPGTGTTNPPAGVAASGSGIAALEGRAVVALANNSGVTPGTLTELGVTGVDVAFAITDPIATPTPRAAIVDIGKCNVCHRVLTVHGQNRTGDINLCVSCHNPNATDIVRHANASPTSPCAPGTPDNPIDFKVMIHQIHASGSAYPPTGTNPTGGVTICSFGGNATVFNVMYPSASNFSLANCNACHNPGTYYPDYTAMQGTTIHAGADRQSLTDDAVISPNSAACSSCHTGSTAAAHMIQNGGSFSAGKTASGALVATDVETCSLCHGSGGVADVAIVHRLARFQ